MNTHDILLDIHALEEELIGFEQKYGILSEIFYEAYKKGEEPENENWVLDFNEWAGIYEIWLERKQNYRNKIKIIQKKPASLKGLIQVTV